MERVRLLMVPGQPLPQPSAAELQTLADVLRARADRVDTHAPPAEGEQAQCCRPARHQHQCNDCRMLPAMVTLLACYRRRAGLQHLTSRSSC